MTQYVVKKGDIVVPVDDLVTVAGIADATGVKYTTVSMWANADRRKANGFPEPVVDRPGLRLWSWTAVQGWLAS